MGLCLCGCGKESGTAAWAGSSCYVRFHRNGKRSVPLEDTPPNLIRSNLKALAAIFQPSDRFPLEVTSADRVLGDPRSVEDHDDRKRLERGLLRVSCPQCGGKAWQEPPCTVNGVEVVVVRCKACDVRKCVECGRPAVFRRDRCAPCRAKLLRGDTMATKGDTLKCPYCREKFTALRCTQVTCGGAECKRLHVNHLTKHPANGAAAPPTPPPVEAKKTVLVFEGEELELKPIQPPVDPAPPRPLVVATSYNPGPLDPPPEESGDPILRAVLAVEALPREKWVGLWDLLEARAEVAAQQRKVDDLLSRLVSA